MPDDATTIIGRSDEVTAVRSFIDSVHAGPVALVLTGEPGIGKSTLLREGIRLARERDLEVLQCRPVESEAQLAFTSLSDLLVDATDADLEMLPVPQRRALEIALLRAEPDGRELPPRAVALAVLGLLQHLARAQPIVIGIDDAHWMDHSSQRVLAFVARRLRDEHIGLLITSRTRREGIVDEVEPGGDLRIVTRHVGALDAGQLDTIVRARLGTALQPRALRRVHELSGGNPMFALHLGQALLDRGSTTAGADLPVPDTLLHVVGDRLDGLGTALQAVQVAAVLSRPTTSGIANVLGSDAIDQLRAAETAGVLSFDGDRVLFTHPLLGSAAYARLDRPGRSQLHVQVAATLDDIEEQARHLALAADRPDGSVAEALDRAAHRAEARGAPDASAEFWEAAARLTPDDQRDAARARRLSAARCVFELGRVDQARAQIDDILATAPTGPTRSQALTLRAWTVAHLEGSEAAARAFRSALDELETESRSEIDILQGLAWSTHQSNVRLAIPHAQRALELAQRRGDDDQITVSRTLSDFLRSLVGEEIDVDRAAAAFGPVRPGPDRPQIMCRPDWLHGMLLMWGDRLPEARQGFEAMRNDTIARGDEQSLPFVLFHLSRAELLLGEWTKAAVSAAECGRSTIDSGQESERPFSALVRALVGAHRGDVDAARMDIAEGLELAERFAVQSATLEMLATRGFIELSVGQYDAANRTLNDVAAIADHTGLLEPGMFRYHGDAIETKIALGQLDEAEGLIEAAQARAETLHRPWLRLIGGRGQGMLEAARGSLDAATAVLTATLADDGTRQPFERARTQLVLGSVHRRNRQKRAARDALTAASEEFARLGARIWVERVQSELSRVGGRSPSDDLTPTERQVAELIAAGKTYREAAAELFISPKTVQWNLSKVYSKLGIRSRAELPGRLREG